MSSPDRDNAAAVEIDQVEHVYGTGADAVTALGPVDLAVRPGEFLVLVGASGCGKSTLLRLIAGFEEPTSGTVRTAGGTPKPGRGAGLVFQQPRLFPWKTVGGNVELALRYAGVSREERAARVPELLARVGLHDVAHRRVWQISGGQQQRVAIARALAVDNPLLLLDEPFAALDALTRERLQEDLRRVSADTGRTSVFVTHSVDEAVFLGSRVVVLSARPGRVALDLDIDLPRTGLPPDELRGLPAYAALRATIGHAVRDAASPAPAPRPRKELTTMTRALTRLTLDPLGPHIGAEVRGLDLHAASDDDLAAVRAALVERKVLFFGGQHLDDDGQVRLGRRLGELTASHPVVGGVDDAHPEVYALDSADNGFADVWHTDVTFVKRPPLGSILRAVVLPPTGGDTTWTDAQLAYDSLSAPVRDLVDGLTAVHDGNREFGYYLAQRRGGQGSQWEGETVTRLDPVEHPVVRVHPETRRKGIFVNPGFTSHIVGVSDAESRAVLDLLYAHLTKPEHLVRHRWRPGDVAMWDNRSTAHYANRDYSTARRVMHRITLRGDVPLGPRAPRPTRPGEPS